MNMNNLKGIWAALKYTKSAKLILCLALVFIFSILSNFTGYVGYGICLSIVCLSGIYPIGLLIWFIIEAFIINPIKSIKKSK